MTNDNDFMADAILFFFILEIIISSTATHSKFYGPYLSGGVPDYDILLSGA